MKTITRAPSISTLVILGAAGFSPHIKVLYDNVGTRVCRRAPDVERRSLSAIRTCSFPVIERDGIVKNAVSALVGFGRPVCIKVKRICVFVSNEVLECDLSYCFFFFKISLRFSVAFYF